MENQSYADVMGTGTGASAAPFIASLLKLGSTIPNYHGAFPGSSEGSYIAFISGDTYNASNGTTGIGTTSTKTIVDLFEAANRNWQAFREDSNGRGGDHFPFLDFISIVNNSSRMTHVHSGATPTQFINAVKSGPGFYWFTPTDGHNMHDNSISSGDSYLSTIIPQILASPAFVNGTGLFILWFDEFDPAPILFIGSNIKKAYISPNNNYDHYSTLRFIENLWGMTQLSNGPNYPSGDIGATPMNDILTSVIPPPPTLTYRLEAPPGAIIVQNTTLIACQNAIALLPASTSWQIFDSNNILISSGTTPPTGSTRPPILTGWGGIFADSVDLQTNLDILKSRGYNGFRCMIYNADFGRYCSVSSVVNAVNVAKSNNMWIILDYHGYTQPFDTDPFWDQVIAAVSGLYNNIVYEPCNEPIQSVSTLSTMYQNWVNKLRATGDTHWFVISPGSQTFVSPNNPFPTVTDPLNQIIYSWHEYYFYQYHSTWNNSDADAFADIVAAPAKNLISQGKYVMLTEFGADPGPNPAPPDLVVGGSAGYAPESLEYTKRLITDLTQMGAGYMLWTADNWSGTAGAGATGALNIWGQLVPFPGSVTPPPPPPGSPGNYTLNFQGFDFDGGGEVTLRVNGKFLASLPTSNSPQNAQVNAPFTLDITNLVIQGANTLKFTHTPWDFCGISQLQIVDGNGNVIFSDPTSYTLNASQTHTYNFTIGTTPPPPSPLTTSFSFTPSAPQVGQQISFTSSISGGTLPYISSWDFGDGTTDTGTTITHTYSTAGTFVVILTVKDSGAIQQTTTASHSIIVSAVPPPTPNPLIISFNNNIPTTVMFTANISGGTSPYTINWDFGDSTAGTGTPITHLYQNGGTYAVSLTVTDSLGQSTGSTKSIVVN